jgi:hypothetical protein
VTTLRDPFDTIHKKELKNKRGEVVALLDYVSWSQAADRLDEVYPEGWSFIVVAVGTDWVHGRLTIGDRHIENIGYAENADAEWKKEVLKDAASDAFKRCAALAGVARYLYDKDSTSGTGRAPSSTRPAAAPPPRTSTSVPDEPEWLAEEPTPIRSAQSSGTGGWTFKELAQAAEDKGIAKNAIYQTADTLFGKGTKVTDLTGPQREQIAFEMGLTG